MKKRFSFLLCLIVLVGFSRTSSAQDTVYSKNTTRVEGAVWGTGFAAGAFLLAQKLLDEVPHAKWGSIPVGFLLGYFGVSPWGFANRYTSSAFSQSARKKVNGGVSDPVFFNKICTLKKESASEIIDGLINDYGYEQAEQALKKLQKELMVAHRWLFKVVKGSELSSARWLMIIGKTEQQDFEESKKKVIAALHRIDMVQHLLSLRKQFDSLSKLLRIDPISVELQAMVPNGEQVVVVRLHEIYGKNETSKELSRFVRTIASHRKKLLELQKKLPFLGVAQKKFDRFVREISTALSNANAVVEIINSEQMLIEVNRIMNGDVSEPTLFGVIRSGQLSLGSVVSFADKYGFPRALERLGRLNEEMKMVIKKLSLCQGGVCNAIQKEVYKIQKNIQYIAKQIKENKCFKEQNKEYLRELQIKTEQEKVLNKGISLKNEKKKLEKEIQQTKKEQKQCERERKKFERDKVKLECELERKKTESSNAKIRYEQQRVSMVGALERETRALKEKEQAVRQMSKEERKTLEAKRKLKEQEERTAQVVRLGRKEKNELAQRIEDNRAKLREVIGSANGQKRELKEIKKEVEENKKLFGSLSQVMNQENNPSSNPECERTNI